MHLMKGCIFWLLYITVIIYGKPDKVQSKFISDFFLDKSIVITAHICWTYDQIHTFLRHMYHQPKLKQIAIYNNSHDYSNYFYHKSLDNYFMVDMDNCISSLELLKQANLTSLFRFPLKYLLLCSNEEVYDTLVDLLDDFSIYPYSNVLVAKRTKDEYRLSKPYRVGKESEITWEKYGLWTMERGLIEFSHLPMAERRKYLRDAKIVIGIFMDTTDTWKHLEDFKFPRIDTFTKQNFGAIKALTEYCSFNPELISINDYGYFNKVTQEFSGLVRLLGEHKVDLSASSPYFTPERFTVVDFIKMQNPLQIRFLLKKPPLSYMTNIFTLPFETNVWIALAVVVILFFGAMYIIMNWESTHFEKDHERERFSPSDIVLIVFEGVCQQGTVTESKRIAGRILQFIMFLGFMFLYTSFSAYIIVLLQSSVKIISWKQLLDSGLGVGGQNTSYMAVYLSGSKNPIHQQIYKQKIGPAGYYPLEVGMAKVQAGFFAFHMELAGGCDYVLEKFTDYEICGLQELEGFTEYFKGYTMVPKNSPYKEIFKVGLLKIDEFGIQRRNNIRFLRTPKCYSAGGSFVSVGIIDMYQAILIWVYGISLAVIVFLIEHYVRWKLKERRKKKVNVTVDTSLHRFDFK